MTEEQVRLMRKRKRKAVVNCSHFQLVFAWSETDINGCHCEFKIFRHYFGWLAAVARFPTNGENGRKFGFVAAEVKNGQTNDDVKWRLFGIKDFWLDMSQEDCEALWRS